MTGFRERHFTVHAVKDGGPAGEPLEFTRASDWRGKPIPVRQWLIPDVIPMGTVTALYGNGGDGKSLLLAQLGVATAAGRQWLGLPTRQGPALILGGGRRPGRTAQTHGADLRGG